MSYLYKINNQINKILLSIEQIPKYSNKIHSMNSRNENHLSKSNSSFQLKTNQNDLLTFENFPFSHLCNRDIRHLPLSKEYFNDFERLHLCSILTMTDLIGRFLIHKTSNDFEEFLIKKIHCSQSFTNEILFLMNKWTLENVHIGKSKRFEQYL